MTQPVEIQENEPGRFLADVYRHATLLIQMHCGGCQFAHGLAGIALVLAEIEIEDLIAHVALGGTDVCER